MAEKQAGTGQLRKLVFTKTFSDAKGVQWRLSPVKVVLWMIAIIVILIALFSFFQEDQGNFLKDVLFYSIITMFLLLIVWIVAMFVIKSRKLFVQVFLAWILILGLYWVLGMTCQAIGLFPNGFHYGFGTWILISTLAIGAKNVGDGNIDRKDVFFAMLVFIIIFIANVPIFSGDIGFLEQIDVFIGWITDKLSFINPQDLIAE